MAPRGLVGTGAPALGLRRLHVLLKREGFQVGVNQTYRWYRLEELQLRS
jgi:putative transposase